MLYIIDQACIKKTQYILDKYTCIKRYTASHLIILSAKNYSVFSFLLYFMLLIVNEQNMVTAFKLGGANFFCYLIGNQLSMYLINDSQPDGINPVAVYRRRKQRFIWIIMTTALVFHIIYILVVYGMKLQEFWLILVLIQVLLIQMAEYMLCVTPDTSKELLKRRENRDRRDTQTE